MKKTKINMNKPAYIRLAILEVSKTLTYEFWHDYIKPKYQYNAKLCYTDTDSFITEDAYKDTGNDVEKRFDTSSYKVHRRLPTGKHEERFE